MCRVTDVNRFYVAFFGFIFCHFRPDVFTCNICKCSLVTKEKPNHTLVPVYVYIKKIGVYLNLCLGVDNTKFTKHLNYMVYGS